MTKLHSFLGIVNYGKFLINLSLKLALLHTLLAKDKKWTWGPEEEAAFQEAMNALHADSVLVHFDLNKPIVISCDASQYRLGADISHQLMEDGSEHLIAYASRTLNAAERNYSQLECEALVIIYSVKKFNVYVPLWSTIHHLL